MSPALIFDCDGVLADTERYGHLPAFNETFAQVGLPVRWSEDDYARFVTIGGGKERMASLLTSEFVAREGLPRDAEGQRAMIAVWHKLKTAKYIAKIVAGDLPPRPGVVRLVEEAAAAGWLLAVASTSAEPAVRAVLEHTVGAARAADFVVVAGDVVERKKPAPDTYRLALSRLGVDATDAVVIEDSANGLAAALAAGLTTVITVSTYTAEEDFSGAALVLTSLGDAPDKAARVLADPHRLELGDEVQLADLARLIRLEKE